MDDNLVVKGLNQSALTFLLQAVYSTKEVDTDRVDRGFRIERVVKNLTDPTRVGTSNAPLKLGDQLLITYRVYRGNFRITWRSKIRCPLAWK